MTRKQPNLPSLEELETVLDVCGGNPRRWPEPLRSGLLRLVEEDEAAARMLREAEALDAVLASAPDISAAACATLADRISAAVRDEPRHADGSNTVGLSVNEPGETGKRGDRGTVENIIPFARRSRPLGSPTARDGVVAGAALAASLVLGIAIGQSQMLAPAAGVLLSETEVVVSVDDETSPQFALLEGSDVIFDEDLL